MADFLELEALTISYGGPRPAVEALTISVARGELVSFLGPSGCGKTTTMRAIAGLLKPGSGTIRLEGEDVTATPPNRRGVGLVFQSYALFPHLSVFENIAFGLRTRRLPRDDVRVRVEEMIAAVGLDGFEDRLSTDLSGGQQQRVALARAIAVRPKLLLLDEPLSNLDARLRLEMRAELSRLRRRFDMTMIYVTHDQSEALALSDRIAVMKDGRIQQLGSPRQVYERPETEFVARFMGFDNLFRVEDGRLVGPAGRIRVPSGDVPAATHLAWRPGGVVLGAGPHRGRVLGASYQGDRVEYLIESPAGPLKAETGAEQPPVPVDTEIPFDLPLATAAVIPPPGAAP